MIAGVGEPEIGDAVGGWIRELSASSRRRRRRHRSHRSGWPERGGEAADLVAEKAVVIFGGFES